MANPSDIGGILLTSLEKRLAIDGETPTGHAASGIATLYDVRGPDLHLTLRDVEWSNGERDVVACERFSSPQLFDTLVERLRLSVLDYDGPYVELRQARLTSNNRA